MLLKKKFGSKVIFGLSDHTFGHNSVLGAIAKGARVIEKHFTDNNSRKGPDHFFAMNLLYLEANDNSLKRAGKRTWRWC